MRYVLASMMTFALLFSVPGCGAVRAHVNDSRTHKSGPGYRKMPKHFYQNGEATVTVRMINRSIGTGTVVDKNGLVLTNYHIVAPRGSGKIAHRYEVCQIVNDANVCSPAVVVASDPKLDLALLRTKRTFVHKIRFAPGDKLKRFDPVYAWARVATILPPSPFGGRYVDKITPKRLLLVGRDLLIFDLSTNPGGSGSPIFDRRGLCVGITLGFTNFKGAPLTVAVPNYDVVKFLRKNGVKRKKTPRP